MNKEIELTEEELEQKKKLDSKRQSQKEEEISKDITKTSKKELKEKHGKRVKTAKTEKEEKAEKRADGVVADEIEYRKEEGFKIFGFSIWRLFAYFIIYSVIGFVIETLFGLATKGLLESRQSFLYGPFCGVYGLGAVVMIVSLQHFKKNNITLFVGGYIVGSIIEYVVSLVGEFIFHVKWWDYSDMPFNINGRICFAYSLFWGVLAIILMTYVNKKIDKFIDFIKTKISGKLYHTIITALILFLLVDALLTAFALKMFFTRLVVNNELELQNVEEYVQNGVQLYEIELIKNISDKMFSDEKMLKTFPNLKVIGKDGNIIYIDSVLKHIQPYYVKVFDPKAVQTEYEKVESIVDEVQEKLEEGTKTIQNDLVEVLN